jgi:predicted PurR-regulated permease PerM
MTSRPSCALRSRFWRSLHYFRHATEEASSYLGAFAGSAVSFAFGLTLTLAFTVVTVYAVLSRWARLTHWAEVLLPIRPLETRQLLGQLRVLGREVMLGTILIGCIQGVLSCLAYAVLGVPQAAFLGGLTAVASTIPAIGTVLVWAPAGAYLIATGHVVPGVCELLWGAIVVVGLSDGFLRPKLVGRRSQLGVLPALVGIFGGIELFGFIGFLLGPTIVGMSLAVLRIYAQARGQRVRQERRAG